MMAPKFNYWKANIMPLDEEWGIVKYTGTEVSNRDSECWYVYHRCGSLSYSYQAPSGNCWTCGITIPTSVIGFFNLCINKNIGA